MTDIREVIVTADRDIGLHGGYRLTLSGIEIGVILRFFPTWERGPRNANYVTKRGVCKKAEYRLLRPGQSHSHDTRRTLKNAVQALYASAIEARSDATGTGAAEGESAAAESRDANNSSAELYFSKGGVK